MESIDFLKQKRGTEQITFNDVADHLFDYAERHPHERGTIERVARFLANVEDVDHDHEADEDRGLTPHQPEPPH